MEKPQYCVNHGTADNPRWHFQPKSTDIKQHGWRSVRLRDEFGQPYMTEAEAFPAAAACLAIFKRWKAGDTTVGPLWIDDNGRVRPPAPRKGKAPKVSGAADPNADPLSIAYPLGTCGSIITDYVKSQFYPTNPITLVSYNSSARISLKMWGTRPWNAITPKEAREVYLKIMADRPTMGRRLSGFMSVALNTTRLMYEHPRHPNRVVLDNRTGVKDLKSDANPFTDLRLPTVETARHPWPMEWIKPFVAHCDAEGFPSLGDGILFNSWLGQRLNDLISFPAAWLAVDRPLMFRQLKTNRQVLMEWQEEEDLIERFHASVARRAAMQAKVGQPTDPVFSRNQRNFVAPLTFVYNDRNGAPFTMLARDVNKVFEKLRDSFAAKQAPVRVDWSVEHFDHDPMLYDPQEIVLGALRHTAVTQLGRAKVDAFDIACITGHSVDTVLEMLEHYRKATLTGARRAFAMRRAYEAGEQRSTGNHLALVRQN